MPAKDNFFRRFKDSASRTVSKFLYGERDSGYGYGSGAVYEANDPPYEPEQQQRRRRRGQYREERYDQQPAQEQTMDPQMMYQQGYQQQPYQQTYAPQQGYQPQQPVYQQQPVQGGYQPPVTQYAAQVEETRARNPQQAQQEPPKVVPFPGSYNGEAPQEGRPSSVRIITIRGFNDCRSAISYLRSGEILLVVMDGIQDQAEMRRYVDMMAGACFSLSASITKVSRHGSYLAAPSAVSVWADPAVNQMNNSSSRRASAGRAAAPQPNYRAFQGLDYAGQQPSYQQAQESRQPDYVQQPLAQGGQEFYARQPQPVPEQPPFEAQARGAGYAPDHEADAQAL